MAHVSEKKKETVAELKKLFEEYPIVGAVNMENLPAPQLQTMRALLRDQVVLRMTKRRLMAIVIDEVKGKMKGVEGLLEHMKIGMPALLFTKENPFKLYKTISKNKSPAPAKAGQIAPKDVIVKAGGTNFLPGPIIGELASLGIKSSVEGGKIAIKEDSVVAKTGDTISAELAAILSRLEILPMEIGLDVTAIYEDGTIYTRDILSVDESKYIDDIAQAAKWAFNLSVEASIPTKENIELFISKSFNDSKAVAIECGILADGAVDSILGKAHNQMVALKNTINV